MLLQYGTEIIMVCNGRYHAFAKNNLKKLYGTVNGYPLNMRRIICVQLKANAFGLF